MVWGVMNQNQTRAESAEILPFQRETISGLLSLLRSQCAELLSLGLCGAGPAGTKPSASRGWEGGPIPFPIPFQTRPIR